MIGKITELNTFTSGAIVTIASAAAPHVAERDQPLRLRELHAPLPDVGRDVAWMQHADGDAVRARIERERARHALEAELTGRVGDRVRARHLARDAADVQDPPLLARDHPAQGLPRAEEAARQVHVDHLAEGVGGELVGRTRAREAGVVHQDVDRAVIRDGRVEEPLDLGFVGHVAGHGDRVRDLAGGLLEPLPATRSEHADGALGGEGLGDRAADAAAAAGHDRDLPG